MPTNRIQTARFKTLPTEALVHWPLRAEGMPFAFRSRAMASRFIPVSRTLRIIGNTARVYLSGLGGIGLTERPSVPIQVLIPGLPADSQNGTNLSTGLWRQLLDRLVVDKLTAVGSGD